MIVKRDLAFFIKLFLIFFKISAFTFGGGLVIITLIRKEFVEKRDWLTDQEMTDFIAIAQTAPGAIAINTSILIGHKFAGILGTIVALIGAVLPPLIIISVITVIYSAFITNEVVRNVMKGMQAGVAAVIVDAVVKMLKKFVNVKKNGKFKCIASLIIMLLSFIAIYIFKVNVVIILVISAIVGIFLFRGEKHDLS
jgi:Chromate transport protein ChrA